MNTETVQRTRRALHGIAENVLAGPQYRTSKRIALRVAPGGFATILAPALTVNGVELVAGALIVTIDGRTCTEIADAVSVDAGAPGNYADGSGVELQERLDVDPDAAAWLADCWSRGDTALRWLDPGTEPVLWPEHFDVAITLDEINYGVSPGDGYHADPYAYVGPHQQRTGTFWNAPFGAVRPMRDLADADQVLAFFDAGRAAAATDPRA